MYTQAWTLIYAGIKHTKIIYAWISTAFNLQEDDDLFPADGRAALEDLTEEDLENQVSGFWY